MHTVLMFVHLTHNAGEIHPSGALGCYTSFWGALRILYFFHSKLIKNQQAGFFLSSLFLLLQMEFQKNGNFQSLKLFILINIRLWEYMEIHLEQ